MGVKFHPKWCSYFAPLTVALQRAPPGPVLEMGAGIHSTQFLHWMCLDQGRELWTFDNDPAYFNIAQLCETRWHHLVLVDDWDDAEIERPWALAFVDHKPAERRRVDIARLAEHADVILYHDSQGRDKRHYHYETIAPLFQYRQGYGRAMPQTTAVSNFVDVRGWW